MKPKEQFPPTWMAWFLVFLVIAIGVMEWRFNSPGKKSFLREPTKPTLLPHINPPATARELAQFRIVTNQFGTMAIEQIVDGTWVLRPNRWSNTNECRWDMEWWIERSRVKRIGEQSEWRVLGTNTGVQLISNTVVAMPKVLYFNDDERHPKVGPSQLPLSHD